MKTKTNLIVQDAMKAVSSQVRLPQCVRNKTIENMNNTIPTAEEFIKKYYEIDVKNHFLNFDKNGKETYIEYAERNPLKTLEQVFIEFATLHVQACKQEIVKNAEISETFGGMGISTINEGSILNSYPIENIK